MSETGTQVAWNTISDKLAWREPNQAIEPVLTPNGIAYAIKGKSIILRYFETETYSLVPKTDLAELIAKAMRKPKEEKKE